MIKILKNDKFKYFLKIKNKGYIPKSGIFVAEKLSRYNFKNTRVLDIGTGETGILAIHSAAMGAKEAIGLDVDRSIIKWARLNARLNGLYNKVRFKVIGIENYQPNFKFDIIISNPPQMPSKKFKSSHDDGGTDGRKYINHVIDFSSKFLKKGGFIFFTAFDFLGINRSYNKKSSIVDYSKKFNLKLSIIDRQKKDVKPGSYTEKNLSWVYKKYPKYSFLKNNKGFLSCYIYLIKGKKL